MDPLCDFCGVQRAVVYCRLDAARLCLPCDGCIHSANALSRRHLRSLVCDGCGSQPVIIRCLDVKALLCQNCEKTCCSGAMPARQRQMVNCYSGCPSPTEILRLWSCVIDAGDLKEADGRWGMEIVAMNENYGSSGWTQDDKGSSVALNDLDSCGKLENWMGPSSVMQNANSTLVGGDQQVLLQKEPNPSKACCPPLKELGVFDDDDFCESFNIHDIDFNFDNSDEMFGCVQRQSRHLFEDAGMDCLFMDNNFSVAESSRPNENVVEASSSIQHDCIGLQSSPVLGPASTIQAVSSGTDGVLFNPCGNRNFNLCFPTTQVQSSMSLSASNLTGESSATDYQDCGVSPMFLTREMPWDSNLETPYPQASDKAKMRYNEKKKTQTCTFVMWEWAPHGHLINHGKPRGSFRGARFELRYVGNLIIFMKIMISYIVNSAH